MLMMRPASPTMSRHAPLTPASMLTRALMSAGITDSRYSSSCSSNHSRHGMETTRAAMSSAASASAAATAYWTSEPVPIKITSGVPSASLRTYAPLPTPLVSAYPSAPRATIGRFCRLRIKPAGRSLFFRICAQQAVVSFASIGRTTSRPGMVRRAERCSIGWWVGPSSPSPIESWVQT